MAEYRTIRMGFWTDPYIEELDAKAKLLYIYLFTGPYTNNLGIVEVTRRKIAYETALTVQEVDKFLAQFESDGKVVCDAKRNIIFVTRFIRHQCSTSPKVMDSLKKLAPSVPSEKIAEALCILYPAVYDVSKEDGDTICIPYGDGTGTVTIPSGVLGTWKGNLEREREGEGEEAGSPAAPPDVDPELLDFARQFQNEVTITHGNTAPKITDALIVDGALELERAVRIDGLEINEVKLALMWAVHDDFWGQNLKSMARMRTKTKAGVTKIQSVIGEYRRHAGRSNENRDRWAGAI